MPTLANLADTTDRPDQSARWRLAFVGIVLVFGIAGALTGLGVPLVEEGGPVERAQIALWTAAAVTAALLSLGAPLGRGVRGLLALLAVLSLAAAAREFDAHIYLNPETLGDLGVRYRIDWWLDGSVSLGLKLGWAIVAVAILAALLAPAWLGRRAVLDMVRARPAAFWCFVASAAALAAGFAVDDLLRNRIDLQLGHLIEEGVELLGPIFYLAGTMCLVAGARRRASG
ncbi:MAG: hypothetical protein ACTS22_08665 [Phycisphaerales bacterium]